MTTMTTVPVSAVCGAEGLEHLPLIDVTRAPAAEVKP